MTKVHIITADVVSDEQSKQIHDSVMLPHLRRIKRSLVEKDGVKGIELHYRDCLDSLELHNRRMLAAITLQCFGDAFQTLLKDAEALPEHLREKLIPTLDYFAHMNQSANDVVTSCTEELNALGLP